MTTSTSRFSQLLAAMPKGPFYEANGYILPFRSSPYVFRFETATPATQYGIYLNGLFQYPVTTDGNGIAIISVLLPQGRVDIQLLNQQTGQKFLSYVEVRRTATWHAAYADVLEGLDGQIEDAYSSTQIQTCASLYLEDSYGRGMGAPNVGNYSPRSYRNLLEELREAFRKYAGIQRGLRLGLEPWTSSAPLRLQRSAKALWILGGTRNIVNGDMQGRTRVCPQLGVAIAGSSNTTYPDLPNINQASRNFIASAIADNNTVVITVLRQPPTPQQLTVTANGTFNGTITINGNAPGGQAISETLSAVLVTALTPSAGTTQQVFASITSITRGTASSSGNLANVGVAVSRCVKVVSADAENTVGSPQALVFTGGSPPTATWDAGASTALSLSPGLVAENFTLYQPSRTVALYGRNVQNFNLQPISTTASDNLDQLYIWDDGFGVIRTDLHTVAGTSVTAASIIGLINPGHINVVATSLTGTEGANGVILRLQDSFSAPSKIQIWPGPSDGARQIFGLPVQQATLASNAAAAATSITLSSADAPRFSSPTNAGLGARFSTVATPITGVTFGTLAGTTPLGFGNLNITVSLGPPLVVNATYTAPTDSAGAAVNIASATLQQVPSGTYLLRSSNTAYTLNLVVDQATFQPYVTSGTSPGSQQVEVFSSTQYQVRLRGRRFAAADGAVTPLSPATYCTFVSATATFLASDIGNYVRITDGTHAGNVGIHLISGWTNSTTVTLLNDNQASNTAFVSASSLNFTIQSMGELHTVTAVSGTTMTLADGLTAPWTASVGAFIEPAMATPVSVILPDTTTSGGLTIRYDNTAALQPPAGAQSDNITLGISGASGFDIPDGWYVNSNVTSVYSDKLYGWLAPTTVTLRAATSADIWFFRPLPTALAYAGYQIRINFWVREHSTVAGGTYRIDVTFTSPDMLNPPSGGSWVNGTNQTSDAAGQVYAGQPWAISSREGTQNPQVVTRTVYIPYNATGCWVKLTRVYEVGTDPAGQLTVSVDRCTVEALQHDGLFCGANTVVRGEERAGLGEVVYVWSAEALTTPEELALGLPPPLTEGVAVKPGIVDAVMPAHSFVERFDVSEYDGNGGKVNLTGAYSDVEWLNATYTNTELAAGTPARLTYARPSRISQVYQEPLNLIVGIGGYNSTALAFIAQYERAIPSGIPDGTATLTERRSDGTFVPIGDTPDFSSVQPWNWIQAGKVQPPAAPTVTGVQYLSASGATSGTLPPLGNATITLNNAVSPATLSWTANGDAGGATVNITPGVIQNYTLTSGAPSSATLVVSVNPGLFPVIKGSYTDTFNLIAGNGIFINNAYITTSSTYLLTYNAMLRVETGPITMPAGASNYVWYLDVPAYTRSDSQQYQASRSVQLQFLGNFTAPLTDQALQDQTVASLVQNNGATITPIALADWSFIDGFTVKINSAVFDPQALYTFTYQSLLTRPTLPVSYRVDVRTASSSGGLASATYANGVTPDAPITPTDLAGTIPAFYQLRVTFFNTTDVRDWRLFAAGLRGVHIYGGAAFAPELVEPGF